MDAGTWGAIGGGLTALSEGLTARELRKQAEEQRRLERERQERMDALNKAIQAAQSAEGLRKENFKRVGSKEDAATKRRILNEVAMGRKTEDYTDPVSGDVYMRGEGESPLDIAQATKERDASLRAEIARLNNARAEDIAKLRADVDLTKHRDPSGNVTLVQDRTDGRYDRASGSVMAQQAGANTRAAMSQAGQNQRAAAKGVAGGGRLAEGAAQAGVFAQMMAGAEKELANNPYGSQPFGAATEIALKGDGKGLTGNAMAALARSRMSPVEQRALQSRIQFSTAAVYAFSGKAITEQEGARNMATFFPQAGETDPAIIAQKKRAREMAMVLLSRRARGEQIGAVDPASVVGGIAPTGSARSQLQTLGVP